MKKVALALLGILALLFGATRYVLWQLPPSERAMVEKLDTLELLRLMRILPREPHHNAGWDRADYPGRGRSPWVFRSNLDGRIRMLNLALAPAIWASYDTERAALQQFWRGEFVFQGPVYDTYHGSQPVSRGEADYVAGDGPAWALAVDDETRPTEVRYLGHFEREDGNVVGIRFELAAANASAVLSETPELGANGEEPGLVRHVEVESISPGVDVVDLMSRRQFRDAIAIPVPRRLPPVALDPPDDDELEDTVPVAQRLIDREDCGTCHNADLRTVGPSWREIALRYSGAERQATATALAGRIIEGSSGAWGSAVMTPHPHLSRLQARQMAAHVLAFSSDAVVVADDPFAGRYSISRDFDVAPRLEAPHPGYDLERIRPEGFRPMVGGMSWDADGNLLLSTWDEDGSVFRLSGVAGDPAEVRVERIAEGLQEPLGLRQVGDRLFVLQKQELTELVDRDADGRIDEYHAVHGRFGATANFHEFAFGLVHRGAYLYAAISVCVLNGGASCPKQDPDRGSVVRFHLESGEMETVATGLRTPNGIGIGPEATLFVTDNQGDWLPASKLQPVGPGDFFGWRPPGTTTDRPVRPPALWLPQDEIGNSPTEPVLLTHGPFAGQMLFGDIYQGGLQRAALERVNGVWQGAVFRFSGGLESSANRLLLGPDGDIFVGEVGNPGNWGVPGKAWFGLERLRPKGRATFELVEVRARPGGFELTLSEPVADGVEVAPGDIAVRQWFYHATANYGGPKYDDRPLPVRAARLSDDRRRIRIEVDGLEAGRVVYLRMDPRIRSQRGEAPWVHESWYTLNELVGPPAD